MLILTCSMFISNLSNFYDYKIYVCASESVQNADAGTSIVIRGISGNANIMHL